MRLGPGWGPLRDIGTAFAHSCGFSNLILWILHDVSDFGAFASFLVSWVGDCVFERTDGALGVGWRCSLRTSGHDAMAAGARGRVYM